MSDDKDALEWSEDVEVLVTFRIRAVSNPDFYEGLDGRTPLDLAMSAAWRGGIHSLGMTDGWADLVGDVDVIDVQEGY